MNRKWVRLVSYVAVVCVAMSLFTLSAFAHESLATGLECNNTGRYYLHGSFLQNVGHSSHLIVYNGVPSTKCNKTVQMYGHAQKCSGCTATINPQYTAYCRTAHDYCPTETNEPS